MKTISIHYPQKLVFGNGCVKQFMTDFVSTGRKRVFLLTTLILSKNVKAIVDELHANGIAVCVDESIQAEPSIQDLDRCVQAAKECDADSIVGIGGGSVLDIAKLVAAMMESTRSIQDLFGLNKVERRTRYLACLPTTSGTGSEVSPNAILYDETEHLKKGVVSPFLVPDAAYVDPILTLTVPPDVTAATGLDALTHCIEAYANKFSHPMIDSYALSGIELIGKNLVLAVQKGSDRPARESLSLASLYGGLCLGPVNTAAVHALAYPLASMFQMPHGISNALLLPFVMQFNMEEFAEPYARIAVALGARSDNDPEKTAANGIAFLEELYKAVDIPRKLCQFGISESAIEPMARSAITIERLLVNNLRPISFDDAVRIYQQAF